MCLPICVKGHFAGMNLRGSIFAFESVQKEIFKYIYICIHLLYFLVKDVFATKHWDIYFFQVYIVQQILVYI